MNADHTVAGIFNGPLIPNAHNGPSHDCSSSPPQPTLAFRIGVGVHRPYRLTEAIGEILAAAIRTSLGADTVEVLTIYQGNRILYANVMAYQIASKRQDRLKKVAISFI
jgi:hypothetical protein